MKQVDENIKNIYQGLIAMENKSMGDLQDWKNWLFTIWIS